MPTTLQLTSVGSVSERLPKQIVKGPQMRQSGPPCLSMTARHDCLQPFNQQIHPFLLLLSLFSLHSCQALLSFCQRFLRPLPITSTLLGARSLICGVAQLWQCEAFPCMVQGGCNDSATFSHRDTRFKPTPATLSLFTLSTKQDQPHKVTLVFAAS